MTRRHIALRASPLWVSLALCALVAFPASAARDKEKKESDYIIRDKQVAHQLTEVRELITEEKNDEAKEILDGIRMHRLKPYPLALVHQVYGFIAHSDEDYAKAVEHFQAAIDTQALPPSVMSTLLFNVAQIYMVLDDWDRAVETLEAWFEQEENPNSTAYYMLGIAYYQSGQPEKALEPARLAVELSDDPREPWLQLLISLHVSNQRYAEALPLLKHIALRYPKKVYWTQLAAVLMEMNEDAESLAVQQLAAAQGFLEEDKELVRLAQMHLFMGMPWQGSQLLQESIEDGAVEADAASWELLANSLLAARENERALGPLERAAELADHGNVYVRLSQVYMQAERWDDASEAVANAFAKGGLKNPAYAHLLVGISAFQQKRLDQARRAFTLALGDERTHDVAQTWIQFVEREEAALENSAEQPG